MNKHSKYLPVITRCLQEVYKRLDALVIQVPPNVNLDIDKKANEKVEAIKAIEEEWILDPILREELTLIKIEDI